MGDPAGSAQRVLGQYGLEQVRLSPLGTGLINLTWLVQGAEGERWVLQRVAPIFPPEVNRDIDRVTRVLATRGVRTPSIIATRTRQLWVEHDGATWRLMDWLPGDCHDFLGSAQQARSAGKLLASFHGALADLEHDFANPRLGVHDTARHMRNLREALRVHANHERYADVLPLAREILDRATALPGLPVTADRVVHGDPKINNMLFDPATGEATALVDLDTVGRMPLPLELGDAFRSWCNPQGEDGRSGEFSRELFGAALAGYAQVAGPWLEPAEIDAIVPALETIILELAARFCADALSENYFGWNPEQFATRGEHNEVRAAGQLSLARSVASQRDVLASQVRVIVGAGGA